MTGKEAAEKGNSTSWSPFLHSLDPGVEGKEALPLSQTKFLPRFDCPGCDLRFDVFRTIEWFCPLRFEPSDLYGRWISCACVYIDTATTERVACPIPAVLFMCAAFSVQVGLAHSATFMDTKTMRPAKSNNRQPGAGWGSGWVPHWRRSPRVTRLSTTDFIGSDEPLSGGIPPEARISSVVGADPHTPASLGPVSA